MKDKFKLLNSNPFLNKIAAMENWDNNLNILLIWNRSSIKPKQNINVEPKNIRMNWLLLINKIFVALLSKKIKKHETKKPLKIEIPPNLIIGILCWPLNLGRSNRLNFKAIFFAKGIENLVM